MEKTKNMKPIYRRMLNLMEQKRKKRRTRKPVEPWFLYILKCSDDTFYTGITKDLQRRLQQHQDGKASRYTRTRRPVTLLYHEPCRDRTQALVRECAVKALSRKAKEKLVARAESE
jgi:predicted GIY-YIG superfamily endonuclease